MNIETTVFVKPISNLYQRNHVIASNLAYILKELPTLSLPDELRNEILTMCQDFDSAVYDVKKEIRNLEDKLGLHPGEEPFDPNIVNPDPKVTMGFIERWIAAEIETLDKLVKKLWALAEQDANSYGLVSVLVTESAGNIVQAHSGAKEELQLIRAQLGKKESD